jgi:hypothetical protein
MKRGKRKEETKKASREEKKKGKMKKSTQDVLEENQ